MNVGIGVMAMPSAFYNAGMAVGLVAMVFMAGMCKYFDIRNNCQCSLYPSLPVIQIPTKFFKSWAIWQNEKRPSWISNQSAKSNFEKLLQ